MISLVVPVAAITLLLLYLSPTSSGQILDTDGVYVHNGGKYYILPNNSIEHPLTYTTLTLPTSTPFYVTESGRFDLEPTAVTLSSPFPILQLPLSSPINITSVGNATSNRSCKDDPMFWFLTTDNANDVRGFARVCGQNGEKSRLVIDAFDEMHYDVYKLSFCVNGCEESEDKLALGWVELGSPDNFYLGINPSNPLPVLFQKVAENEKPINSIVM